MKKRVALIASTLEGFGLVKMMYYLVKYINRDRFSVYIVTLSPEPENSYKREFEKLGVKVLSIGKSRLNGFFFASSALQKVITSNKIDVVHSHGFRADLTVKNIKRKSFKWIITAHSDPDSEKKHFLGSYIDKWRRRTHIKIIKQNKNNVVAVSKSIQFRFRDLGVYISRINNGIEVEQNVSSITNIEIKKKYSIPLDKKVCLVLSGLTKKKNIETIVSAFASGNLSNYYLLIAGDGEENDNLQLLSGSRDNICFLGYVSNPTELFKISDFYLTASLFEGLSLSLLEAMSYGLIPVISLIPSHREVVENSILENNCFDCFDWKRLIEILQSIEDGDMEIQSALSKEIVRRHYHAKDMARFYEGYYQW